jgi:hypothetical protein
LGCGLLFGLGSFFFFPSLVLLRGVFPLFIYLFIYLGLLYTRIEGQKILGPTLSIFRLQIGFPNFMVSFFSALGPIEGHKVQHLLALGAD